MAMAMALSFLWSVMVHPSTGQLNLNITFLHKNAANPLQIKEPESHNN
jgi:hypothetical protein